MLLRPLLITLFSNHVNESTYSEMQSRQIVTQINMYDSLGIANS